MLILELKGLVKKLAWLINFYCNCFSMLLLIFPNIYRSLRKSLDTREKIRYCLFLLENSSLKLFLFLQTYISLHKHASWQTRAHL